MIPDKAASRRLQPGQPACGQPNIAAAIANRADDSQLAGDGFGLVGKWDAVPGGERVGPMLETVRVEQCQPCDVSADTSPAAASG
jgi:hypothetical protein